jgi:NADH dehydrogenase
MKREPGDRDRVVIVGAGFGGFQAAQSLAGADADVILIDRHNYHTFIPLLYQVATAQLEPHLVAYPIRTKLRGMPNVRFLQAEVEQVDFRNKLVGMDTGMLSYDYLVIATGAHPSYHNIPGAAEHTFPLNSLTDAVRLRDHCLRCFERAALTDNLTDRRQLMTFTIIGGGATGVEMAGALAEWLRGAVQRDFPQLTGQGRIVLVQSGSSLLSEFAQRLGNYTHRQLERLGVEVHLNTKVGSVTQTFANLSDDYDLPTRTVIWAAGIDAAQPDVAPSVTQATKGKLVVNEYLQVSDYPNVYAIGDVAYLEQQGQSLSGVAPEALQQGVTIARNLKRHLNHQPLRPFRYLNKGRLAIVGGYGGVGQILGINFGGFLAWLMWLLVHVTYLPGYRSRLLVLLTWLQNYGTGDRAVRQIFAPHKRG